MLQHSIDAHTRMLFLSILYPSLEVNNSHRQQTYFSVLCTRRTNVCHTDTTPSTGNCVSPHSFSPVMRKIYAKWKFEFSTERKRKSSSNLSGHQMADGRIDVKLFQWHFRCTFSAVFISATTDSFTPWRDHLVSNVQAALSNVHKWNSFIGFGTLANTNQWENEERCRLICCVVLLLLFSRRIQMRKKSFGDQRRKTS